LADLTCCGRKRKANAYPLTCELNYTDLYKFQHLYVLKNPCPGLPADPEKGKPAIPCGKTIMQWRGEAPDGTLSPFYDIDPGAHAAWLRRIVTDKARPEAQLMSEYSHKIASGNMVVQFEYTLALTRAHRWFKGERVKSV